MNHPAPATIISLIACSCAICWAEEQQASRCSAGSFSRCSPVDEHRLAQVRGGYDLGGGLQVSFGVTRTTHVNGELVAQSQLLVRDLKPGSHGSDAAIATWMATGPNTIQLGAGNSVRMDQLPLGAMVIQNSLDNQNIRNLTVIDATSNSLQLLRGANALGALRDVLSLPSAAR